MMEEDESSLTCNKLQLTAKSVNPDDESPAQYISKVVFNSQKQLQFKQDDNNNNINKLNIAKKEKFCLKAQR